MSYLGRLGCNNGGCGGGSQECYLPCENFFIRSRACYQQRHLECLEGLVVSATGSSTGTINISAVSGTATVVFTGTVLNRAGLYNTSTGVFTTTCKGSYTIHAQVTVSSQSPTGPVQLAILKNDVVIASSITPLVGVNEISVEVLRTVKLCPGDLISIQLVETQGDVINVTQTVSTFLEIIKENYTC